MPFPASAWRLLWAIFLAVLTTSFSGGWFIASMAERVHQAERDIVAIQVRVHDHEILKGHAGVVERVDGIAERVQSLERRVERAHQSP